MAFNNNTNNEEGKGVELWSRQQDVLKQITIAEDLISKGERLQNPIYDAEFGAQRNLISLTMMLQGCDELLVVISPNLKDRKKDEDGERKTGTDSDIYAVLRQAMNTSQVLINQAQSIGPSTPIGRKRLEKAYGILKETRLALKEETNRLGYDFRPKEDPTEAWKQ